MCADVRMCADGSAAAVMTDGWITKNSYECTSALNGTMMVLMLVLFSCLDYRVSTTVVNNSTTTNLDVNVTTFSYSYL